MSDETLDLTELKNRLSHFASERNWEKYHTAKNIACALSVEASELLEIFQWKSEQEVESIKDDPQLMTRVSEEVADILLYTTRLCGILGIDIPTSIENKIEMNTKKYPSDRRHNF